MQIALIDHYDSFSFNVIDWLGAVGFHVHHCYHDDRASLQRLSKKPLPLVFSPGPKSPADIPASMMLLKQCYGRVPILGICLGHQMLGVIAGSQIRRAKQPMHGQARPISLRCDHPIFTGVPDMFAAAAYNSLAVDEVGVESGFSVIARSEGEEVEAISAEPARGCYAIGFQFHPESFLTTIGVRIAENWRSIVEKWYAFETSQS